MNQDKVNIEKLADEVYKLMQAEARKARTRGQNGATRQPGKRR